MYRGYVENHNDLCPDGKINGLLDCRMCGLPTGGKPESLHRGKFIFVSQVFLNKEGEFRV